MQFTFQSESQETENTLKDKVNCNWRTHGTFDNRRVIQLSLAVINVSLTFCPCSIFFLYLFILARSILIGSCEPPSLWIYNQRLPCRLWHLYHAECTWPTQYLMKEIWQMFLLPSHVPPSVSSPWKHVTESVYPHFPIFPFFCDMMASCCFEIRRWRGGKKPTSLMWHRETSKEFAASFDLEVIRWVLLGRGSCWLIHGSSTTVTWPAVINGQGFQILLYQILYYFIFIHTPT